jgi:hypothetical protein
LLARFGLVPVAADLPEIRRLIQSEIADDERESNEPLKTLCIQLFSAGVPGDALLIWKAKTSDFDAGFYIDIQLKRRSEPRSADCGLAGRGLRRHLPREGLGQGHQETAAA